MRENKVLVGLLFVGLCLRVIGLDAVPPALNSDELLKAFDGASVYLTGRDHHNQPWPLFFEQSGEYSPPLYIYFSGLFSAPFGVNAYTVRLPSALLGTLSILLTYLFTAEFAGRRIGLLAAALVVFSPWNLHYSRIGWEAILQPPLQLAGLWLFLVWIRTKTFLPLAISALVFGSTFYAYPASRVFIPLLLLGLCAIYYKELRAELRHTLAAFLLFILVLLPYLFYLFRHYEAMQARWKFLSIFEQGNGWNLFFIDYLLHLSPNFLFFTGDPNPLHRMGSGLALSALFPFFLIGILRLGRDRLRAGYVLGWWFFLFAVPSALTNDRYDLYSMPNALRSVCGMNLIEIVSAYGLYYFLSESLSSVTSEKQRRIAAVSVAVLIAVNMVWVGYNYAVRYPLRAAAAWQYGLRKVIQFTEANQDRFDRIVFSPKVRLHPVSLAYFSGRKPGPFQGADFPKYVIPFITYVPIYQDFGMSVFTRYSGISQWYYQAPGRNWLVTLPNEITGETPLKEFKNPDGGIAYRIFSTNR